jgi:hypothetical protein
MCVVSYPRSPADRFANAIIFLMGATPSLHTQLGYKMAAVMQGAPDKVVMRHVLPHMALDRAGPER